VAHLVDKILEGHAVRDGGGRFRVLRTGDVLHVVPSSVKDRQGNWGEQRSPLDARISLPRQEQSGLQMLDAVCAAVSGVEHVHVVAGMEPINLLRQYRAILSADNEPARLVLLRVLQGAHKNWTWSLLYDEGLDLYALNVRPLPDRAEATGQSDAAAARTVAPAPTAPISSPFPPDRLQ
jgi:hypothetical protein